MIWKTIAPEMTNFNEILNHILGIALVIIIFSIAYAYLKPHQLHKRRLVSTLVLKLSYLFYLLVMLVIIDLSILVEGGLDKVFYGMKFFVILLIMFIPTIGIFARKLGYFSKKREEYNYFFTTVNLLSVIVIVLMYLV